ncbi:MAG TPA: HAD family hydrolase [Dermatophilaceae bacterium]|nr:HAD family hydrolase [Dermatophilaceae bacterium]
MRIPSAVRAVFFDLDRTLLDHDRAGLGASVDWLRGLGVGLDDIPRVIALWQDAGVRQMARFRSGELSYHDHRRERVREIMRALGLSYSHKMADNLFAAYLNGYARHWVAYEDAAPVMRLLRESGRLVSVLTNGDIVQQRSKLRQIGLLDLCDDIFASSQLPAGKPDPRAFKAVATPCKLAPQQCLMVGDDLETDIRGALNAGWHAVHVDRTVGGRHAAAGGVGTPGAATAGSGAHRVTALAELTPD